MHVVKFSALAIVITAIFGGACSAPSPKTEAQGFAATIPPVAMLLEELTGDVGAVHVLLRPGASPHTYETTPGDAMRVADAMALVWVSDDLDGWAARMDARAGIVLFDLLPPEFAQPLPELDGHDHDDDDHHHHGDMDPHFWLDPLAIRAVLHPLAAELGRLNPENAAKYREAATRFSAELDDLDAELRKLLEPLRGTKLVLHHPSMNYFLSRYGMEVAGYVESSPGKEPSPQYVARLVGTIQREGVALICTEPQLSQRGAQVVAESAGIPIVELDPLGGVPGLESYGALLRHNAEQLLKALR